MGLNRMFVAVAGLLQAVVVVPAFAQSTVLEEVIVTAQKRSESLQDTPIAISAFSGEMLNARGITDAESLASSVPGMHFSQSGADTRITVRGIGTEQTTVTGDPGVALHVDGVYQSRASAGSLLFYDLERVEVLRGPQGTLYGRNATGGSINVISNKPQDAFDAALEMQAGNYNQFRVRGFLNTPLVQDTLMWRVSAQHEQRDGYYENLTPDVDDLEDRDALNIRSQLLYLPSDSFSALLSVNYSNDKSAGPGGKPLGKYPAPKGTRLINLLYGRATPNSSDPWTIRTNLNGDSDFRRQGASLTLDWELGDVALKSITAYQENRVDLVRDLDQSDTEIINETRFQDSAQFSQELQLTSTGSSDLQWLAGLYFLSEENDVQYWLNDQGTGLSVFPFAPKIDVGLDQLVYFGNDSTIDNTSMGAFAQASYNVSDSLKVTAGLRYSRDEKEADIARKEFLGQTLNQFEKKDSWTQLTWKAGVDWFVSDTSMAYFSASTGFKSGGFLQIETAPSYDEENVLAFELGSKNRFFDDRLQANVSAYYYQYTDMQLRTIRDLNSVVSNAGEAEIKGIELELVGRPMQGLLLSAELAYTNATFTDYFDDDPLDDIPKDQLLDLSGNDLARSPDFTANIRAAYTWGLAAGELTASVSYFWSDEVFFSAYNRRAGGDFQDSYHKTNASLRFDSSNESWFVAVSARNLENAEVASQVTLTDSALGGANVAQWQEPQLIAVSAGVNF